MLPRLTASSRAAVTTVPVAAALAAVSARFVAGAGSTTQVAARALASSAALPSPSSGTTTPARTRELPWVKEQTVRFTLVDYKGEKQQYVGLVGQTLLE